MKCRQCNKNTIKTCNDNDLCFDCTAKFPLSEKEWSWQYGGFTEYAFKHKLNDAIYAVKIDKEITVDIGDLYALVEEYDHLDTYNILKKEYGDVLPNHFDNIINMFRKIVRDKWKEKYDGVLPHLYEM